MESLRGWLSKALDGYAVEKSNVNMEKSRNMVVGRKGIAPQVEFEMKSEVIEVVFFSKPRR